MELSSRTMMQQQVDELPSHGGNGFNGFWVGRRHSAIEAVHTQRVRHVLSIAFKMKGMLKAVKR